VWPDIFVSDGKLADVTSEPTELGAAVPDTVLLGGPDASCVFSCSPGDVFYAAYFFF